MMDMVLMFILGICVGFFARDLIRKNSKKIKPAKKDALNLCNHQWESIGRKEEKRLHCVKCNVEM